MIVIWAAYIKLVAYHHFRKGFKVTLKYLNENNSVKFFISQLSVQYEIQMHTFLFDLRC